MTSAGPLEGVRIIEMDAIGPVPLCGMILSGLGAEVVRITRPGGQAAYDDLGEAVVLRGRSTIELNMKDKGDVETLLGLVAKADALIEGMRPGVMERLGIGPAECLARNPGLVYGRGTGWGQTGPLARTAGHDINYIAMTGALHAIAQKDQIPTVPLNLVGDYAGGTMFLALGLVSAILSARTTGQGQVVDAGIVDGVAVLMSLFHAYVHTGTWEDRPASNFLDGAAPYYRCYRCEDGGFVAVGCLEPQFFAQMLAGLDLPADAYVQTDRAGWPKLEADLAARFASAPRAHWEKVFAGTDACVSPVLSITEALHHPDNAAKGIYLERDGVMQAAPAPRFSGTPGTIAPSRTFAAADLLARWSGS